MEATPPDWHTQYMQAQAALVSAAKSVAAAQAALKALLTAVSGFGTTPFGSGPFGD